MPTGRDWKWLEFNLQNLLVVCHGRGSHNWPDLPFHLRGQSSRIRKRSIRSGIPRQPPRLHRWEADDSPPSPRRRRRLHLTSIKPLSFLLRFFLEKAPQPLPLLLRSHHPWSITAEEGKEERKKDERGSTFKTTGRSVASSLLSDS